MSAEGPLPGASLCDLGFLTTWVPQYEWVCVGVSEGGIERHLGILSLTLLRFVEYMEWSQPPWGARGGTWTPSLSRGSSDCRMRNPGKDTCPKGSGSPVRGLSGCCRLSTTAVHVGMNRPAHLSLWAGESSGGACPPNGTSGGRGLYRLHVTSASESLPRTAASVSLSSHLRGHLVLRDLRLWHRDMREKEIRCFR